MEQKPEPKLPAVEVGGSTIGKVDEKPNRRMRRAMKYGHVLRPHHWHDGQQLQRVRRPDE